MSTDYLAALRIAPSQEQALEGKAVEAFRDTALTAAMQRHRISVAEEALSASLLEDLRDRSRTAQLMP